VASLAASSYEEETDLPPTQYSQGARPTNPLLPQPQGAVPPVNEPKLARVDQGEGKEVGWGASNTLSALDWVLHQDITDIFVFSFFLD